MQSGEDNNIIRKRAVLRYCGNSSFKVYTGVEGIKIIFLRCGDRRNVATRVSDTDGIVPRSLWFHWLVESDN